MDKKSQMYLGMMIMILGAFLFVSPVLTSLSMINPTSFSTCDSATDSRGYWTAANGGTLVVDTTDKVEGTGSMRMDVSSAWQPFLEYDFSSVDLTATPYIRFSCKVSSTTPNPIAFNLLDGTSGAAGYGFFEPSTADVWEIFTFDLRVPTDGVAGLTDVRQISFYWNIPSDSLIITGYLKIDNVQVGADDSSPTPTPAPTGAPTPTPTPTPASGYTVTVSSASGGTTNPIAGSYLVATNGNFQITATANSGYEFTNWIVNGASNTNNPLSITITSATTVQPVFSTVNPPPTGSWQVTVSAGTGGSVSPSGLQSVTNGQSLTVTATANSGYEFSHWVYGTETSTVNPLVFSGADNGTYNLDAVFIENEEPEPVVDLLSFSAMQLLGLAMVGLGFVVTLQNRRK